MRIPKSLVLLAAIAYACVLTGWGTLILGIDQIAWAQSASAPLASGAAPQSVQHVARPKTRGGSIPIGDIGLPRAWEGGVAVSPHSIVNLRSGTMTTVIPVTSWDDRMFHFEFNLYYSSLLATQSSPAAWPGLISPGKGWSTSYSGSVRHYTVAGIPTQTWAEVIEDDGTRNKFQLISGTYQCKTPGVFDFLDGDNTEGWVLTRPDQSQRVFDNTGKLIEEITSAGASTVIARSGDHITISPQGCPTYDAFYIQMHASGKPLYVIASGFTNTRKYYFAYGEREWDPWTNPGDPYEDSCESQVHCGYGLSETCNYKEDEIESTSWFNWFIVPDRVAGITTAPPCDLQINTISFRYNSDGTLQNILERDGLSWSYSYQGGDGTIDTAFQHPHEEFSKEPDITQSFVFCVPSISVKCLAEFSVTPPGEEKRGVEPASWSYYTDPRGFEWSRAYDDNKRLMTLVEPVTFAQHFYDYDIDNNVTTYTDPLERDWDTTYGDIGNPTSITTPLSTPQVTTMTYAGPVGPANLYRLTEVEDPAGWTTGFEYESGVDPIKVTTITEQPAEEMGATAETILTYSDEDGDCVGKDAVATHYGLISTVTDANGVQTAWNYSDGPGAALTFFTDMTEGAAPAMRPSRGLSTIVNNGNDQNFGGESEGNWMEGVISSSSMTGTQTSGGGASDEQGENAGCLVVDDFLRGSSLPYTSPRLAVENTIPSPLINTITDCGANSDRVATDLRDPVGRPLSWDSCTADAPIESCVGASMEPRSTRTTTFEYDDPFRRLTSKAIKSYEMGFCSTRTFQFPVYDEAGNILTMIGSDERETNYEYDHAGRVISVSRPDGKSTIVLAENFYDVAGRLEASVAANGAVTFYFYDEADRITDIQHVQSVGAGEDQLARVHYEWTINNLVEQREEYTSADPKDPPYATVDFTYDLRGRLIREERDSVGSDDYDFSYTYDQLGNRLTKTDNLASPAERVRYLYDVTDPANCPEGFETHNNRLMKYVEETFVESLRGGDWVETREVAYTYYRTGHASNITVKDYSSAVYRDLAMYYDVQGRLVIALWDSWELITEGKDAGLPDPKTYVRDRAVEFRYDNNDARQRYMMRAIDEAELPSIVPLASPLGQWVEYSGSAPFADAEYEHADDMTFAVTREYDPTVEREVGGDELYLHGDLIGSAVVATDDAEDVDGRAVYTAFGELVGTPTLVGTRYRYAGEWGYEEGLLTLDGAMGTAPIVLLHLGERWYQPNLGRFVQRDPIGLMGGANCYLYAGANPLALIDPSGRNPIDDVNDFIARNFWQRIFSEDHLVNMSDSEMYAWGIGVPIAVGAGVAGCMVAGRALAADGLTDSLPDGWEWGPPSGDSGSDWHLWDPNGGEWRFHAPDGFHDTPHWDYNPWDQWNSPWQNVPTLPI